MTENGVKENGDHDPVRSGHETPLDSMTVAIFDVDARIFRTMLDSFIRPARVATAAIGRDYARYLSPIRVFIALFSFQFVVAALFGTPVTATLDTMTTDLPPDDMQAWLATARRSFDEPLTSRQVNDALVATQSIALWPITVLSSLPYLLALKLYRPSTPIWGHLQIYLVATNASFMLMIALIPLQTLGGEGTVVGITIALISFFVICGILLAYFYGRSVTALILRLLGLLALLPVTMIITIACTFLTIDWVLANEFGLDFMTLLAPDDYANRDS
ncbi:DUF3667 domain-containing protein [Maricaulis sp.]|uniref:DUF3667 domain-containing protein n=1 Tax=Maricaulis sp. TaxID=1486257 RepID=UPI002B270DF7|nr:DUF3667 domain-containing protein [Maricaulis sp.]